MLNDLRFALVFDLGWDLWKSQFHRHKLWGVPALVTRNQTRDPQRHERVQQEETHTVLQTSWGTAAITFAGHAVRVLSHSSVMTLITSTAWVSLQRSGDFSQYQLAGLLQRNNLNQRLEGVEKEINHHRYGAVEEEFGQDEQRNVESRRLISEDSSHYILIKGRILLLFRAGGILGEAVWWSTCFINTLTKLNRAGCGNV